MQEEPGDPTLDFGVRSRGVAVTDPRFCKGPGLFPEPNGLIPALGGGHAAVNGRLDFRSVHLSGLITTEFTEVHRERGTRLMF